MLVLNRYYIPLYYHQHVIGVLITRRYVNSRYRFTDYIKATRDERKRGKSTRSRSRSEVRPTSTSSVQRWNTDRCCYLRMEEQQGRCESVEISLKKKERNYSFLSVLTIAYQRRSPKPRADLRIHDLRTIQRAELFAHAGLVPLF